MYFRALYKPFKDKPLRGLVFFVWLCWLVLQLFFIHADPDVNLSTSRDAFTDEGLYTCQVRNYLNHGVLRVDENDCLIKTPLFSGYLMGPMYLFDTRLVVARLSVLLGFALIVLWIGIQTGFAHAMLFFIVLGLFQYHLFQYAHFSMAEILCTGFALLGVCQLIYFANKLRAASLVWASCWLVIATLLKIQFAYLLALLPVGVLLTFIYNKDFRSFCVWKTPVMLTVVVLLCWFILFWWGWYKPYRSIMNYVMQNQVNGRFPDLSEMKTICWFNIRTCFLNKYTFPLTILFIICLKTGFFIIAKERNKLFSLGFWMITAWIFLEVHKLSMTYLPSRYLVSFWVAMAFLCSWVLGFSIHLLLSKPLPKGYKLAISTMLLSAFFMMMSNRGKISRLWKDRTYIVQNVNEYIDRRLHKNDVVLGPWAPNLCWSEKAYTATVWKDYFNDKDVLNHYHPRAVISETDEIESDKAFSSQGIDLQAQSDSVCHFKISKWDVNVYWMKKQ